MTGNEIELIVAITELEVAINQGQSYMSPNMKSNVDSKLKNLKDKIFGFLKDKEDDEG